MTTRILNLAVAILLVAPLVAGCSEYGGARTGQTDIFACENEADLYRVKNEVRTIAHNRDLNFNDFFENDRELTISTSNLHGGIMVVASDPNHIQLVLVWRPAVETTQQDRRYLLNVYEEYSEAVSRNCG